MEYKVKISETCLGEINEIFTYIEDSLKAEIAANNLIIKIEEHITNLKKSPKMYATIETKDRLNKKYRKIVIDNYIILYTIIEEDRVVLISHMYYGGRNYLENLI